MKNIGISILLVMLTGCGQQVYETERQPPEFPVTDHQKKIVLIDKSAVYTSGIIGLKKKERIVSQVKQEFLRQLSSDLENSLRVNVIRDTTTRADDTLGANSKKDAVSRDIVQQFLKRDDIAYILVLKSFTQGFDRDWIEKTTDNRGTVSRKAYYSIFCASEVEIFDTTGRPATRKLISKKDFGNAIITGALVDPGPSFEANKDALTNIARLNAADIVQLFQGKQLQVRVKKADRREAQASP